MRYKTLKEIIAIADELNPNAYSNNIKAQWVNEVETAIQTEVFVIAPVDVVSFLPYEDKKDKELSLDETWDKIYLTYLQAMIDFSNKEYAAFNNDIALYNSYVDTYAKWYVRHHGEGEALISGMYISAYGIAVKHGFSGTEEEWLGSLKGVKGDRGEDGKGLEIKGVVYEVGSLPENANIGDVWCVAEEFFEFGDDMMDWITSYEGRLYCWTGSKWQDIGPIKGAKGDRGEQGAIGATGPKGADGYTPVKGVDYWTKADKAEILSEIPKGGTWTKLADITTTEEVGSVIATSEEFPDLPKCKEIIARVMFPKSPTGANLALGASEWYFNGNSPAFYSLTTTLNPSAITEVRVHITLAGRVIQAVGTQKASDVPAVVAPANILVGTRNTPSVITSLDYRLTNSANVLPIGTIVTIYGKVEE